MIWMVTILAPIEVDYAVQLVEYRGIQYADERVD